VLLSGVDVLHDYGGGCWKKAYPTALS